MQEQHVDESQNMPGRAIAHPEPVAGRSTVEEQGASDSSPVTLRPKADRRRHQMSVPPHSERRRRTDWSQAAPYGRRAGTSHRAGSTDVEKTTGNDAPDLSLLRRIRGEFVEMPGLALTVSQARRLWALDEQTCADLLDALVRARFLRHGAGGTYLRMTDGLRSKP